MVGYPIVAALSLFTSLSYTPFTLCYTIHSYFYLIILKLIAQALPLQAIPFLYRSLNTTATTPHFSSKPQSLLFFFFSIFLLFSFYFYCVSTSSLFYYVPSPRVQNKSIICFQFSRRNAFILKPWTCWKRAKVKEVRDCEMENHNSEQMHEILH